MSTPTVRIACEGHVCNAGHSAKDREAAALSGPTPITAEFRDEATRHARSQVSRALAVTPHVRCGSTMRAGVVLSLFACQVCAHERVYGNVSW